MHRTLLLPLHLQPVYSCRPALPGDRSCVASQRPILPFVCQELTERVIIAIVKARAKAHPLHPEPGAQKDYRTSDHCRCRSGGQGLCYSCRLEEVWDLLSRRSSWDPPRGEDKLEATEGSLTCALDIVEYVRANHGDYVSIVFLKVVL